MALARFGRRESAVGMEAIRGCALGRRSARDPGMRQIRVEPRNEPRARRSQHGGHWHERRCSAWDGGRSGRACSRKGQHAPHRGVRGVKRTITRLTCNYQAPCNGFFFLRKPSLFPCPVLDAGRWSCHRRLEPRPPSPQQSPARDTFPLAGLSSSSVCRGSGTHSGTVPTGRGSKGETRVGTAGNRGVGLVFGKTRMALLANF